MNETENRNATVKIQNFVFKTNHDVTDLVTDGNISLI